MNNINLGKPHSDNMDEVIADTSVEMQKKINEAKKKGDIPKEAIIVSNTETAIFFGSPLELARFRKKWVAQAGTKLPKVMRHHLQQFGRAMVTGNDPRSKVQFVRIFEIADVQMEDQARAQIEENATPEAKDKNRVERLKVLEESQE